MNLHFEVAWMSRNSLLETRGVRNLNDCNGTGTQNHLVCKRTLNHLAKLVKLLNCDYNGWPLTYFHSFNPTKTSFEMCHHCVCFIPEKEKMTSFFFQNISNVAGMLFRKSGIFQKSSHVCFFNYNSIIDVVKLVVILRGNC